MPSSAASSGTQETASVGASRSHLVVLIPRLPSLRERALFDAWAHCRLSDDPDFPPGRLIPSLKRIERTRERRPVASAGMHGGFAATIRAPIHAQNRAR